MRCRGAAMNRAAHRHDQQRQRDCEDVFAREARVVEKRRAETQQRSGRERADASELSPQQVRHGDDAAADQRRHQPRGELARPEQPKRASHEVVGQWPVVRGVVAKNAAVRDAFGEPRDDAFVVVHRHVVEVEEPQPGSDNDQQRVGEGLPKGRAGHLWPMVRSRCLGGLGAGHRRVRMRRSRAWVVLVAMLSFFAVVVVAFGPIPRPGSLAAAADNCSAPTPTPTPEATPTATPEATPTATPSPTPGACPTPTPGPPVGCTIAIDQPPDGAPTPTPTPGSISPRRFGPTFGTKGDDVIYGTPGRDRIFGLGGNDTIFGLDGADYVNGGEGNDFLCGGAGADRLVGGRGTDFCSAGNDRRDSASSCER